MDSEFSEFVETDSHTESEDGPALRPNMKGQLSIIVDDKDLLRQRSRTIDPGLMPSSNARRRWSSIDHEKRSSRTANRVHAQTTRNPGSSFRFGSSRTVPYGADADDENDDEQLLEEQTVGRRRNQRARRRQQKRKSAQLSGGENLLRADSKHQRSGSAALSAFQDGRDKLKSVTDLLMREQIKQSQQLQGKKRKKRKGGNKQRDSAMTEITQSVFEHRVESSGTITAELSDMASPRVFSPPINKKRRKKKKKI